MADSEDAASTPARRVDAMDTWTVVARDGDTELGTVVVSRRTGLLSLRPAAKCQDVLVQWAHIQKLSMDIDTCSASYSFVRVFRLWATLDTGSRKLLDSLTEAQAHAWLAAVRDALLPPLT